MRGSIFDSIGNLDTLLAVVVGAVLATSGALVAELIQDRLNRRRRERDAARFFGEIMTSIDRILDTAITSQRVGDPWGPVTRRLFRMALREAAVYERNRERLFDIRDVGLRTRIHTHMLTTTFPVDAITDYSVELDKINDDLLMNRIKMNDDRRFRLEARTKELAGSLDAAFDAVQAEMKNTAELCEGLEKMARVEFSDSKATATDTPVSGGADSVL